MPFFKSRKVKIPSKTVTLNSTMQKVVELLNDNESLSEKYIERVTLKNNLQNFIDQAHLDEKAIKQTLPHVQANVDALTKETKKLEKDQKRLEETFSKLTERMDPVDIQAIHQAYHASQPSAPDQEDTSSLPSYDRAQQLYPSPPTTSFVITDGIGQEGVTPVTSLPMEEDEDYNPSDFSAPAQSTRSKTAPSQDKLKSTIQKASETSERLQNLLNLEQAHTPAASGSVPYTTSTPNTTFRRSLPEQPHPVPYLDDSDEELHHLPKPRSFRRQPLDKISLREYHELLTTLPHLAGGTTITKWINRILDNVPHGHGDTSHDCLLLNKMISLLKKSGTSKEVT